MRILPLCTLCAVLVYGAASAAPLSTPPSSPPCTLKAGALLPIVLPDGSYGMVFPLEMLANGDSVLILGLAATADSASKPIVLAGDDSSLLGFLLTHGRRVATPIPAPHNMTTARYFRTRLAANGWESVFFVPDRDTVVGARVLDSGTLWYARLVGRHWRDLERVGHVDSVIVMRPASSDLVSRAGVLQFAIGYRSPQEITRVGGVMIFRRLRPGKWQVDTIPVKGPSLTVTTPASDASLADARFFPVAGVWEGADFFPGSMLSVDAAKPLHWSMVRRGILESMNDPVEIMVDGTMHTSWWEEGRKGARASIWYQALDPSRENDPAGKQLVVAGITAFKFLAVPEEGRTRPVWAYQTPSRTDTAEVAVVANGEPVVIGRVAFPFGFMTNGVASGERSFILATPPRPIPGEGPPASRTLEVRVDCRGAPGTMQGGTHEVPVEDARALRSTGGRRLHR